MSLVASVIVKSIPHWSIQCSSSDNYTVSYMWQKIEKTLNTYKWIEWKQMDGLKMFCIWRWRRKNVYEAYTSPLSGKKNPKFAINNILIYLRISTQSLFMEDRCIYVWCSYTAHSVEIALFHPHVDFFLMGDSSSSLPPALPWCTRRMQHSMSASSHTGTSKPLHKTWYVYIADIGA